MSHPVFALFNRALRLESRAFHTYARRGGLLLFVIMALFSAEQTSAFFGAPGLRFFRSVIMVNVVYITITGLSLFASAITEEKEEQTLGLLRMTALSPVAILLGKSTTRLLDTLFLLLAQIPFTLLAIALGGVSLTQVAAAYIALIAYTVMLCNLALLWSVVFKSTGNAAGMLGLCLLLFFSLPHLGESLVREAALAEIIQPGGLLERAGLKGFAIMQDMSVFRRLLESTDAGFSGTPTSFQAWSNLVVGALCFLLSWAVFDRFTRQATRAGGGWRLGLRRGGTRRSPGKLLPPGRAWDRYPLAWKEFTFVCGGIRGMLFRSVLLLVGVTVVLLVAFKLEPRLRIGSKDFRELLAATLTVLALAGMGLELAFAAANVLRNEIRDNTLANLIILPMTSRTVIRGKLAGYLPAILLHTTLLLGAALSAPEVVFNMTFGVLQHLPAWLLLGNALLVLYLTAFLSIVQKRSALALAVLGVYLGNMLFMMFSAVFFARLGYSNLVFIMPGIVSVGLVVLLHLQIPAFLERKAGGS